MFSLFDRMSLRARVFTLAAAPLAVLLAACAATLFHDSALERAATEMRRAVETARIAADLSIRATMIRRDAQTMVEDRNLDAGADLSKELGDIIGGLARLSEESPASLGPHELDREIGDVKTSLVQAQALLTRLSGEGGAEGALLRASKELSAALRGTLSRFDSYEMAILAVEAMRMLRAEHGFIRDRDVGQIAEFDEAASRLAQLLPAAPITRADAQALTQLSSRYAAAFRAWTETIINLDGASATLAAASRALADRLKEHAERARDSERAAAASTEAARGAMRGWLTILSGLAIALTTLLALLLSRSIAGALTGLRESMNRIKSGLTDAPIEGLDRKDEIGEMARALAVFRDHALERQAAMADQIRQAQTREKLLGERDMRIVAFEDAFARQLATFQTGVAELSKTSNALARLSSQFSTSARDASRSVNGATEDVTSVAIATEELSYSVGEVSARTEESRASAEAMARTAAAASAIMGRLNQSANQIGDVIGLIQKVAAKTNLLSLNATIEAARAGEAGRGFAVVAQEVKGLATQTERATADVRALIDQLRGVAGEAHVAFDSISRSIATVVDNTIGIATAITQQKLGIDEINLNLQSASSRSRIGADAMRALLSEAESAAESATLIESVAHAIGGGAASLNDEVARFLRSVRAQ